MKTRFSTRVVATLAATGAIIFSGLAAPQSEALTVKEANPQGCTIELDARDTGLYTQILHDYGVAVGDFWSLNAGALGVGLAADFRDSNIADTDRNTAGFLGTYGGYHTYEDIRGQAVDYAEGTRTFEDDMGMLQSELRADGFTAAADEALAMPGRLGVLPNAYARTLRSYWNGYYNLRDGNLDQEGMRQLALRLRKEDVDKNAVVIAATSDLYRATVSACEGLIGYHQENYSLSNDLASTISALALTPGQFYNAHVVRFPFSLLPAGSSVPGM
ncbi:MAG: hypothetical protein Q3962_09580 [Corynebacterium sp.]|nr:hypothetical protein [Corynebacterium sp.]